MAMLADTLLGLVVSTRMCGFADQDTQDRNARCDNGDGALGVPPDEEVDSVS